MQANISASDYLNSADIDSLILIGVEINIFDDDPLNNNSFNDLTFSPNVRPMTPVLVLAQNHQVGVELSLEAMDLDQATQSRPSCNSHQRECIIFYTFFLVEDPLATRGL